MFHNASDCPQRNQLLLQQSSNPDADQEIPYVIYGQWMTNERQIPEISNVIQQQQPANQMI